MKIDSSGVTLDVQVDRETTKQKQIDLMARPQDWPRKTDQK